MSTPVSSVQETPVFIPSRDAELFAILTRPPGPANGIAVVLLAGGLYTLSINRNRLSVELARRLAGEGFHVLRLDLHGVGESSGEVEEYRLDRPWDYDLVAATRWLEQQGLTRFVLIGSCFGGRVCLSAAPSLEGLEALALLAVPVTDGTRQDLVVLNRAHRPTRELVKRSSLKRLVLGLIRGKTRSAYWRALRTKLHLKLANVEGRADYGVSGAFLQPFEALVRRGTPLLLAYGSDDHGEDLRRAMSGRLGQAIARGGSSVHVRGMDAWLHGFPSVAVQEQSIELIEEWIGGVAAGNASPAVALG